jgi:hypothetical protein
LVENPMTNKLNKQYFETRTKHKNNVNPKAWIIWIILLISGLIWIINERSNQKNEPITEDFIVERMDNLIYADQDTIIKSSKRDFQILIKQGLYYGPLNHEMPLMIVSNDSTNLILFVKSTTANKEHDSLIEQWESKITKTNSSYKFSEIQDISTDNVRIETGVIELIRDETNFIGRIMILQNNYDIYILQGMVINKYWKSKRHEIEDMLNNFEII